MEVSEILEDPFKPIYLISKGLGEMGLETQLRRERYHVERFL